MAYCRNCGHDLGGAGAKFCPECGTSQEAPEPDEPTAAGPVERAPLIELRTHAMMTGRPARISVYESGVEYERSDPFRRERHFMRYDQIAQVAVRRGLLFSTLVVESRGGAVIVVESLPKRDTDLAADLIDRRSR